MWRRSTPLNTTTTLMIAWTSTQARIVVPLGGCRTCSAYEQGPSCHLMDAEPDAHGKQSAWVRASRGRNSVASVFSQALCTHILARLRASWTAGKDFQVSSTGGNRAGGGGGYSSFSRGLSLLACTPPTLMCHTMVPRSLFLPGLAFVS